MDCPSPSQYFAIRDFVRDFYKINKARKSSLSFRFFAKKLNWPPSYLNDVIQGRKRFTVDRAIEMSQFLKLSPRATERLVLLTLIQNKDKKATRFFSDRLKEEFNSEKYFPSAPNKVPENSRQVDESVFSDISLLAIFDLIRLKRGKLTEDQISSYLYTFPELSDKLELRKKLSQLKSAGLIQYRSTRGKCTDFKAISKRLFFQIDAKTAHHMTQYSENLKRALQRPEVKIWLGSGFVSISKEDFPEFRERYFEFRNWVLALDDRAGQSAGPTMLFQFDMNVFNLVHCPETINCKLSAW